MGVLDDAIREHLELKRQHGAPETEITQQEAEALGPARRQAAEPNAEAEAAEPDATVAEAEPEAAAEPEAELVLEHVEQVAPELPMAPEPEDGARDAEPDWGFESEPEPAAGDTPARGFEQVDDAPPPAEDVGEEDVLEETPDFLQETPEHDRLWFEQKPPRDFDFDE